MIHAPPPLYVPRRRPLVVPSRRPVRPRVPKGRCPVHPWRRARPELLAGQIRFKHNQILFTDGQIAFAEECCCCDPCANCPDSPTPCAFDVTITGWLPGTCEAIQDPANSATGWALDGGGSLDGTYRLTQSDLCGSGGGSATPSLCCQWEYVERPPVSITPARFGPPFSDCGYGYATNDDTDELAFTLFRDGAGFTLTVDYSFFYFGEFITAHLILAEIADPDVDCNVTGAALTDVRTCADPPNHYCFGTGGTAVISASRLP